MMMSLTIDELAEITGISASHLSRIEKGGRFPSARVLRQIAGPLGLGETELLSLAGYLSPRLPGISEQEAEYIGQRLDPYVARVLAQEPIGVQQAVISILSMLKSIARTMKKEE